MEVNSFTQMVETVRAEGWKEKKNKIDWEESSSSL